MKPLFKIFAISACLSMIACNSTGSKKDVMESAINENKQTNVPMTVPDTTAPANWTQVLLETDYGNITIALNPATPKHTENFIKLVKSKYYDGVLFHRVIPGFMIQTGDPVSKTAKPDQPLGEGGPSYKIPAEFVDTLYHFKGALAAARQGDEFNPMKMSSGSQFYIVTGTAVDENQWKGMIEQGVIKDFVARPENREWAMKINTAIEIGNQAAIDQALNEIKPLAKPLIDSVWNTIPTRVKNIYASWGGTPFLDKNYTVFGKVTKGYYVLDKIQNVERNQADRPKSDIRIKKASVL